MAAPLVDPSTLQRLQSTWEGRISQAAARGFDPNLVRQVARQDYLNVAQGRAPMTLDAAQASVTAAMGQNPVVTQRPTGPLGVAKNIVPDIRDITWSFPAALGHFIRHLPSETHQTLSYLAHTLTMKGQAEANWEQAHGFETTTGKPALSELASGLRNVAKLPLVSVVPGMNVLAESTSHAGRQQLQQHPVGTLLDVLPDVGTAAKLGAFGAATADAVESSASLSALSEGRPVKALVRAIGPVDAARLSLLDKLELLPEQVSIRETALGLRTKYLDAVIKGIRPFQDELSTVAKQTGKSAQQVDSEVKANLELPPASRDPVYARAYAVYEQMNNAARDFWVARPRGLVAVPVGDMLNAIDDPQLAAKLAGHEGETLYYSNMPGSAHAKLVRSLAAVRKMQERLVATPGDEKLHARLNTAQRLLQNRFSLHAPAEFMPALSQAEHAMIGTLTPDVAQQVALMDHDFALVPPDLKRMYLSSRASIARTWTDMLASGDRPSYVHQVPEGKLWQVRTINPLKGSFTPGQLLDRTQHGGPYYDSVLASVGHQAWEVAHQKAVDEFAAITEPMWKSVAPLREQKMAEFAARGLDAAQSRDAWNTWAQDNLHVRPDGKAISASTHRAMQSITAAPTETSLGRVGRRFTHVFKTSLFALDPKFQAHIWLGNAVMLAGRGDPRYFLDPANIAGALRWAAHPDEMPATLQRGAFLLDPDKVLNYKVGEKFGGILSQAGRKVENLTSYTYRLASLGDRMWRSLGYLSKLDQLAHAGKDVSVAAEEAAAWVTRTFVDHAGLSPMERYITDHLIPFYPYTRHVLRYILTYPTDHPLRAEVLSQLAETWSANKDAHSALGDNMDLFFTFGHPNGLGENFSIDARSIDPFRNTADMFTLAGFLRSVNPLARGALDAAGFDVLSGSSELYPNVTVDPTTGNLVAAGPSDAGLKFAQNIIPEIGIVDAVTAQRKQLAALKATNPDSYRRYVFSMFNIPYMGNVNLKTASAAKARGELKVAQQDVSQAIKTGNLSLLDTFTTPLPVPAKVRPFVQGAQWMEPQELKKVLAGIIAWEQANNRLVI